MLVSIEEWKVVSMGARSNTNKYSLCEKIHVEVHACVLVSVVLNCSWRKIFTTILAGRRYGIFILYYISQTISLAGGQSSPPRIWSLSPVLAVLVTFYEDDMLVSI
jgi:hypothetical protein